MADKTNYILTIGIETHVQLKTKSKLFSGADNDAKDAEPNSLINHIDFGLPGALPVLNKKAIELATRAAFALNSKPEMFSKFDRKHYFYPDLPMGYQISQYDQPIIAGGYVEFMADNQPKKVNITRAHLEADAGKSTHPDHKDFSLIDLNRAGTPLLEIVSEPEMHSAAEARAYAHELYLLMRYADVSDANLFYGNMRFDVNVSVSKDKTLGTRTETKNLNSFRSVERAVAFEMDRQIRLLEVGEQVVQQTRGWNDSKNEGYLMRSKENADDYRYMPDPDLPPIQLDEAYISGIEATIPKLPSYWRQQLAKHQLDSSIIESLIEAEVEFSLTHLNYLKDVDNQLAKAVANWIVNIEIPFRRQAEQSKPSDILATDDLHRAYEAMYKLYNESKLSSTNVKELIIKLLLETNLPKDIESYADGLGLIQNSDQDKLSSVVSKVLGANEQAVKDIKAGEDKAIGYIVGQVMKETQGKANPTLVKEIIVAQLKK